MITDTVDYINSSWDEGRRILIEVLHLYDTPLMAIPSQFDSFDLVRSARRVELLQHKCCRGGRLQPNPFRSKGQCQMLN